MEELIDVSASLFFVNEQFIPSLFFIEPHTPCSFQETLFTLLEKIWHLPAVAPHKKEQHIMGIQELFFAAISQSLGDMPLLKEKKKVPSSENYHTIRMNEEMWGAFSLKGKNTSMGYLQKGEVKIVAMGPHYPPLYSEKAFGIFHIDQNSILSSSMQYEGWTRTTQFEEDHVTLGSDWLHISLQGNQGYQLKVSCQKQTDKPLFFSFFVACDFLSVDGKEIEPNSLDKYSGSMQKIILKKGDETLTFDVPQQKGEILPLAGGEFFWGANYIIAFELDCNNKKFSSYIF